jgi:hypothetical protein
MLNLAVYRIPLEVEVYPFAFEKVREFKQIISGGEVGGKFNYPWCWYGNWLAAAVFRLGRNPFRVRYRSHCVVSREAVRCSWIVRVRTVDSGLCRGLKVDKPSWNVILQV